MQASLDFIVRLSFRTTAKKQFAAELIVNDKIAKKKRKNDLLAALFLKIFCAFSRKEAN